MTALGASFDTLHSNAVEHEKRLSHLKDLVAIQCNDGNWNYAPYSLGMFNGLELALSVMEGRSPRYRDKPDQFKREIALLAKLERVRARLDKGELLALEHDLREILS